MARGGGLRPDVMRLASRSVVRERKSRSRKKGERLNALKNPRGGWSRAGEIPRATEVLRKDSHCLPPFKVSRPAFYRRRAAIALAGATRGRK